MPITSAQFDPKSFKEPAMSDVEPDVPEDDEPDEGDEDEEAS